MDLVMYKSWNEEERKTFRDWLKSHLLLGEVTVTFVKRDGSTRDMKCTLKESNVVIHDKKTDRVKEVNEEICPVFDLDKQEWRSFRYDSVKEVRFEI